MSQLTHVWGALLLATALTGCGYGSVAAALSGGGSSTSNAPSAVTNLSVTQTKVSPATLVLALVDAEGDPAIVRWSYADPRDPTGEEVLATALGPNPMTFFQDAPRSFTAQPPRRGGSQPRSVVAADMDGDGDVDLATANDLGGDVTVFFQDAPRTFTAQAGLAAGVRPHGIIAADLDGDGDTDLVCANKVSSDLAVFWGR
ncbi:MAG: FG-GAP-like repeat-containing protein [Planctomycetota bacterium]